MGRQGATLPDPLYSNAGSARRERFDPASAHQTNIRGSIFGQPSGFVSASGVLVPHAFAGEFGAVFVLATGALL